MDSDQSDEILTGAFSCTYHHNLISILRFIFDTRFFVFLSFIKLLSKDMSQEKYHSRSQITALQKFKIGEI